MKPAPLKNKRGKGIDFDKFRGEDIKSAVEWLKEEIRKSWIRAGVQLPAFKFAWQQHYQATLAKVDIAFEDVTK